MKKLKTFLTFSFLLIVFFANAQIKVHSDGQISIGSLTKQYGIQHQLNGHTTFQRSTNPDYSWITVAQTTNIRSKCWIVRMIGNNIATQSFYVTGQGIVHGCGYVTISDSRYQQNEGKIENPSDALTQMNGFYYTNIGDDDRDNKRHVGFSAQEIQKVLPEAVESDEDGILYLNYDVLTVFLVEAVKEQQREIESLRKALEDSGIFKE